jgi:hypothetical protein
MPLLTALGQEKGQVLALSSRKKIATASPDSLSMTFRRWPMFFCDLLGFLREFIDADLGLPRLRSLAAVDVPRETSPAF